MPPSNLVTLAPTSNWFNVVMRVFINGNQVLFERYFIRQVAASEISTGAAASKSIIEHLQLIDLSGLKPITGNSFTFTAINSLNVVFPTANSGYLELPNSWLLGSENNAISTVFENRFKLEDIADPNEFEVYYSMVV